MHADTLLVRPKQADGRAAPDAELPRSLICALTAELSVAIAEKPWDFFDHTDLLDFPGARSRLKLANLGDVAKAKGVAEGANPLRELLLRGKVAYLFQRYSAERELSAILLCIPDGNQEVRDLSDMMTAWIDQTIGATPAERAKQKNALFLVLTKMDREFEQKAGETEESRKLRWSARLNNSLINNFRGEWPANWDGKPFDNTFWLRNPDRDRRAADGLRRRPRARHRRGLRRRAPSSCAGISSTTSTCGAISPIRRAPGTRPSRPMTAACPTWCKNLIPVCDPAIKRAQVRGQLEVQIRRLVDRLAGFHSAADGDARAKKRDLVHTVLRGLATCIQQQLFGELVAALQIADIGAARDLLPHRHGALLRARPTAATASRRRQVTQSTGAAVDLGAIFADVFGEDAGRGAPPSGVLEDRAERFAREAADYWLENMRRVGADEKALSHFGVDRQHLGWLIDELVVGAHRLKVIDQLSHEVRELENAANAKWEEIAERQVRTASSTLNGYVSALGFDRLPLDQRPGLPPNAPTRRVFEGPPVVNGMPIAERGSAADLRRLLQGLDARLPAARHGQCRLRGRPRDHAGAERPAGRHPARRARLGAPWRSALPSRPWPSRATRCCASASSTPRPRGWRSRSSASRGPTRISPTTAGGAPRPGCCPSGSSAGATSLEFHLGPEICDRLAGIATVRLRVKEPDIGVVGSTVVAWPSMLTSGAADPASRFQDDTVRLRRAAPPPPPEPAPEPEPELPPPLPPPPAARAARLARRRSRAAAALRRRRLADRRSSCSWPSPAAATMPTSPISRRKRRSRPSPQRRPRRPRRSAIDTSRKTVRDSVGEYLATKPTPEAMLAKARDFAKAGDFGAAFLVFRQRRRDGQCAGRAGARRLLRSADDAAQGRLHARRRARRRLVRARGAGRRRPRRSAGSACCSPRAAAGLAGRSGQGQELAAAGGGAERRRCQEGAGGPAEVTRPHQVMRTPRLKAWLSEPEPSSPL